MVSEKLIEKVANMPSFQLAVSLSKWVPFVWLKIEYYQAGFYLCCHGSFNPEPGFCSTFKTRPTSENRLSINETLELMKLLRD